MTGTVAEETVTSTWLKDALRLTGGETPFPWQESLLRKFTDGIIPRSLDIPTGLGKTSAMALWLIARACGAAIPRRLVYVVDRRAVVDQATNVAQELRELVDRLPELKHRLNLNGRSLPISTLRGQYTDNKDWLEDPSIPAIIVGTIDMVGSRLLFEGYGVSRKMRPYHAGLLGADALLVLDEAHLVPPFEKLLEVISESVDTFGPRGNMGAIVPPLRLLSLSATGRTHQGETFGLEEEDLAHPIVDRRLTAQKRLFLESLDDHNELAEVMAQKAWGFCQDGPVRVIVFCNQRDTAEKAKQAFDKQAKRQAKSELLVGARRVYEREKVKEWLTEHGFMAGRPMDRHEPVVLFATSAGEVGIDLDADHMVSDVVAWERMVQRFGRVNRRGDGDAKVIAIAATPKNDRDGEKLRLESVQRLLERLPVAQGETDVSPGAIRHLKEQAKSDKDLTDLFEAATSSPPLRPALTRPLVDAWSMTSLSSHTGRPNIQPWLRGWVDDKPRTMVIWRTYLPVNADGTPLAKQDIEAFFEAAPPHTVEMLETESFRVAEWLKVRAKGFADAPQDSVVGFVLSPTGDLQKTLRVKDLSADLKDDLAGMILVVSARVAGLCMGLLDKNAADPAPALDGGIDITGFRVRIAEADEPLIDLGPERLRLSLAQTQDGEVLRWLIVHQMGNEAPNEDGRALAKRFQLLEEHQNWAKEQAERIAKVLGLPDEYIELLVLVARVHDVGKKAPRWQTAFKAPNDGIYAKTRGPINQALLDGYRHELGSLLIAERDPQILALQDDMRDLALHLIASHHGFARPMIGVQSCDEAPPSTLRKKAGEIALRFARLQNRWGPWGLAWWEALLRAADQQASKEVC